MSQSRGASASFAVGAWSSGGDRVEIVNSWESERAERITQQLGDVAGLLLEDLGRVDEGAPRVPAKREGGSLVRGQAVNLMEELLARRRIRSRGCPRGATRPVAGQPGDVDACGELSKGGQARAVSPDRLYDQQVCQCRIISEDSRKDVEPLTELAEDGRFQRTVALGLTRLVRQQIHHTDNTAPAAR